MQRVFLSPPNPLSFEAGDGVLLAIAVLFLFLNRPVLSLRRWRFSFLENRRLCVCILFLLPIALRLLLLPRHPVPVPSGADDFGYLLLADTLRHFRLANPPHAFPDFFEQVFVLQRPTYSSMFNLGQGIVLAFGWLLFGQPWAGVLLSIGALSALTYWMLLGWTGARWAFAGGILTAILFGPLSYWTNSYWGGAVAACAGSLVFGAIPRRNPTLLGCGIALHLLVRPFETIFLVAAAALFWPWRSRLIYWAAAPVCISLLVIAAQNKAVTGSWTTLPYQLYRDQYGIPATFTFQRNPVPHVALNAEKQADYEIETATHGFAPETIASYALRLVSRLRFLRFFLFAPLYLAAALGLRYLPRAGLAIALFMLGSNFYPYFYPHYIAAAACLFILLSVIGLAKLRRAGPAVLSLCLFQFVCWYCAYAFSNPTEPSWSFVNGRDPQGRKTISDELVREPGKHLVFVHYSPDHRFSEWVHNAAEIDTSKVIYANDLGPTRDEELRNQYPDRRVWLLEPDTDPPSLRPFPKENTPFLNVP